MLRVRGQKGAGPFEAEVGVDESQWTAFACDLTEVAAGKRQSASIQIVIPAPAPDQSRAYAVRVNREGNAFRLAISFEGMDFEFACSQSGLRLAVDSLWDRTVSD
jgi:hypothetical protein